MMNGATTVKDLTWLLALALLSLVVGLAVDLMRSSPLGLQYLPPGQRLVDEIAPEDQDDQSEPGAAAVQIISIDELWTLQAEQSALVIDVRARVFYEQGHIPGAHSLQIKKFEIDFTEKKSLLDQTMEDGKKFVLYCAGIHCPDASKVAKQLYQKGYRNLCLFEEGLDLWKEAGMDVTEGGAP